jgi:ribonuclease III
MKTLETLATALHLSFKNSELFQLAFVHRSYLNETRGQTASNERLEFLGDSILSFIVSRHLYQTYPVLAEGELTNLRSSVVKTTTLAMIAKNLHLGEYLLLSRGEEEGGGRTNPSILADVFEALLGAIVLDQGVPAAEKVIARELFPLIPIILSEKSYKDAKSSFQELVQNQTKLSPVYKVIMEEGPDHAKEFTVGVYVGNKLFGEGKGKSKQIAEQVAAARALEKWPVK